MEKLSNPKKTIEILQKYSFCFQKRFGQNFLIDEHVIRKIIRGAGVTKEDTVLEIGPGIGTLTQYLAEAARYVVAVEVDKKLLPILEETLQEYDNVTVINADILETDVRQLAEQYAGGGRLKVVANLPYYITTPIIMGLFEKDVPVDSMTVMVQNEGRSRQQGLRCAVAGRAVLCRAVSGGQCAAQFIYAAAECRLCGDPSDTLSGAAGSGQRSCADVQTDPGSFSAAAQDTGQQHCQLR